MKMLKSSSNTLYFFLIVNLLVLHRCCGQDESFCDDGKSHLEKDLTEDITCADDEKWSTSTYMKPAGEHFCTNETILGGIVCMDADVSYDTAPPLGGHYRPIPPRYGEYSYLPPQRWVHSLMYGALVFLYHPCVSTEHIDELRNLAKGCLWKHIITPYPHLTQDEPLAIVAYGCVYKMKWVDAEESEKWILQHALRTLESSVTRDGEYDHGLLEASVVVSDDKDSNLCLSKKHEKEDINSPKDSDGKTPPRVTPPPTAVLINHSASQETDTPVGPSRPHHEEDGTNRTVIVAVLADNSQRTHVLTAVFLVFCVLLLSGVVVSVVLHCKYTSYLKKRPQKSYKGFRGFLSSKGAGPSYIPSTGTPKVPGTAKQRLLDSDEEEIM